MQEYVKLHMIQNPPAVWNGIEDKKVDEEAFFEGQ